MSETLIASEREIPRDDAVSFAQLYRENRDAVYALVASMLRNRAAAEDVTSTTFERAFRARASFDSGRAGARAWLFRIARNAAIDEQRRLARRQVNIADGVDPENVSLANHEEEDGRNPVVAGAVEKLCARDRELIALKYYVGLSNVEISEVLGISESNVGTRLHRIMCRLREECHAAV